MTASGLNLKGNIFGGITAAIIALPLALAFGVASGLGATAGLYGAIILGFFASLLGGTPSQISGPTGPMTVVVAAAVTTLGGDIAQVAAVIMLSGIIQIIFSVANLGRYVRFIPYPVISGFMSGIGVIIIILQINPFLGLPSDASIIHLLLSLPENIAQSNLWSVALAAASLAIVMLTPVAVTRVLPAPLIALLILTTLSSMLALPVTQIGEIPSTLPDIIMPSWSFENYRIIITLAVTIAILGTIDTLLTSIVADSITQTRHDPKKELFGQGIGNTLCAFVGAIPGAGATMRTVVNVKSGGTNRISGMLHAVILLLIVLFFAPLASQIPLPVLSGILIKVGIDILDYRFLKVWNRSPGHDLVIMASVFFVTVFVDLITAVGVGIVLASLLIVYRITKATQIELVRPQEEETARHLELNKVRIITINGAFFFGSSTYFEHQVNAMLDIRTMIIDIVNVPFIDITAIFTLKDLIAKLHRENVEVIVVTQERYRQKLMRFNDDGGFDTVRFYDRLESAIMQIRALSQENEHH